MNEGQDKMAHSNPVWWRYTSAEVITWVALNSAMFAVHTTSVWPATTSDVYSLGINFAIVREFGGPNFAIPERFGESLFEALRRVTQCALRTRYAGSALRKPKWSHLHV